jgi:glycosyltransferase involved in cell wall biosynthesis
VPLVSVLMSVHDDEAFVGEAVDSVLGQTLRDLELLVVDDASSDATPDVLARFSDERLTVLRNETVLGLAASLNLGLDAARGRYVARLDADDVALPERLERQVERLGAQPAAAAVGTAVIDVDESGRRGRTHVMPHGARPLRWLALFSSPFFHPTVLVDRDLLDAHGLRYDPTFPESEDYDLWTRLLVFADGDNLPQPLVLKRVHPAQASQRRGKLQESFQQRVALREIARLAPEVAAEPAWRVGAHKRAPFGARREFLRLLAAFDREHGRDADVWRSAFRALVSPRRRA